MTQINHSTIVQLLFRETPLLNFAGLVTELETALDSASSGLCEVDWDHDDIVMFEADGCRFVLAFTQQPSRDYAACLTLSVGPAAGYHEGKLPILTEAACRMIINRLELRYAPDEQRWHSVAGPVGTDEVDALVEALMEPDLIEAEPQVAIADIANLLPELTLKASSNGKPVTLPQRVVRAAPARDPSNLVAQDKFEQALHRKLRAAGGMPEPRPAPLPASVPEVANDRPDLPSENDLVIQRVRDALYPAPQAPEQASTPLRLAAHSMDATLIIVALPVGAAMLTYSLLRGGNANVSARAMAITCTFIALSQVGLTGPLAGLL